MNSFEILKIVHDKVNEIIQKTNKIHKEIDTFRHNKPPLVYEYVMTEHITMLNNEIKRLKNEIDIIMNKSNTLTHVMAEKDLDNIHSDFGIQEKKYESCDYKSDTTSNHSTDNYMIDNCDQDKSEIDFNVNKWKYIDDYIQTRLNNFEDYEFELDTYHDIYKNDINMKKPICNNEYETVIKYIGERICNSEISVLVRDMYKDYKIWCALNNIHNVLGSKEFLLCIKMLMDIKKIKINGIITFVANDINFAK